MDFFINNIGTVILVPLWVFVIILFGKLFAVMQSKRFMSGLTYLSTLYGLIFSIFVFAKTTITKGFTFEHIVPFITLSDVRFNIGVYVDGLSAWMLLVVFLISLLVQIYSYFYMQNDKSFMRYFAYMNLFTFSMSGLILAPNMFQTYVFWELVGISSYLLIGFWYKKNSAQIASKKAFIMNRIGDFSLLSGIITAAFVLYENLGRIDLISIPFSSINTISAQIYGCTSDGIFIIICIFLILGSVAKSAQFPLHTWLIDAMQGPTPVSALIHSATMVAAGVYLLCRLYPLYSLNDAVLQIIAAIGIITALICSYAAITQVDIKKILAYSTTAQLGLMFVALGMCSVTVSMIHLTAHAFIKSMLFLSAGIVIKAMHENQDIRQMGALRKYVPIASACFLIGALSLSGLLFAGFSSKELILGNLINEKHYIYAILFLIISFMTAFYLFRAYFTVFEGKANFEDIKVEKPAMLMNFSPAVLAVFVVLLWFVLPKSNEILFVIVSYLISISAIFLAYLIYINNKTVRRIPVLYDISYNAFYIEDFNGLIVRNYKKLANLVNYIDNYIFDGIVYMSTFCTRFSSLIFSKMQTGNLQSYLAYSLLIITASFGGLVLVYNLIMYFLEV